MNIIQPILIRVILMSDFYNTFVQMSLNVSVLMFVVHSWLQCHTAAD